jgi:hypothetical protein
MKRPPTEASVDHNPFLKPWIQPHPNRTAGKGTIERPGDTPNLTWQTRSAPPTEYENQLGDTLEQVFESGAASLDEVVAGLNERGFRTVDGHVWDGASFEAEMKRLAAK